MESYRFDELTRRLAAGTSRRALLSGVLGGLLGGIVGPARRRADAQSRRPNGSACARATDCASFRCVDGVCCNSACTGQCEVCNLLGKEGICSPVTGQPVGVRQACPGAGPCEASCDGVIRTSCATWPGAETSCGAPTCTGDQLTTYACGGNGTCHPTTTSCAADEVCSGGACRHCGLAREPCCPPDDTCPDLFFCDAATGSCQPCGLAGQPCCPPDNACFASSFCDEASRTCQRCGGVGFPCCPPDDTCGGFFSFCDSGTCQSCGRTGRPCCPPDNTCEAPSFCDSGTCRPCTPIGFESENACTASTVCCDGGQCVTFPTFEGSPSFCRPAGCLPGGEPCTDISACCSLTCSGDVCQQ